MPLAQFRHYLKPWRPHARLRLRTGSSEKGDWMPATPAEAEPYLLPTTFQSLAESVGLFTVSQFAVAKLAALSLEDCSPANLQAFYGDVAGYFHSIKLPVGKRLAFQLLGVAPGCDGIHRETARRRFDGLPSGQGENEGDAVVNLGPGKMGVTWTHPMEKESPLQKFQIDPGEGFVYSPYCCLPEIDTQETQEPTVILACYSGESPIV